MRPQATRRSHVHFIIHRFSFANRAEKKLAKAAAKTPKLFKDPTALATKSLTNGALLAYLALFVTMKFCNKVAEWRWGLAALLRHNLCICM